MAIRRPDRREPAHILGTEMAIRRLTWCGLDHILGPKSQPRRASPRFYDLHASPIPTIIHILSNTEHTRYLLAYPQRLGKRESRVMPFWCTGA
ncbi:hypothetical protein ACWEU6_03095 [Streptosporangium sandarakinum]